MPGLWHVCSGVPDALSQGRRDSRGRRYNSGQRGCPMKKVLRPAGTTLLLLTVACLIWPSAPAGAAEPARAVTFTKDIAPILQRSCQSCHRPDSVAPMSLITYEQVRPFARAIKLKTSLRQMPPWYIEKNVGIQEFKGDLSLSDKELATIAAWVDSGAPQGNPADMPPPASFPSGPAWTLGTPDLIV